MHIYNDHNLNKEIIQWACETLACLGYILKVNSPEKVRRTPWSHVVRFETTDGYIYLKHTPELIGLEANIIQILHDQFHSAVPIVIAHNAKLNCFLMKDAGRPLREILKQKFDEVLLYRAINQFKSLQLVVADHVNVLLDMGVPDWRLNKFPDLYKAFISQKDLLITDGLTEIEVNELGTMLPKISNLCEKLSRYSIKQTIVQPDFNDNNILIDDKSQDITLIDLGEIVISHPFFSLLNCLHQIKKHHGLKDEDAAYIRIKNVCFTHYMNDKLEENLQDAIATAQNLSVVYEILAQHRLLLACGKETIMSIQHRKLSNLLRKLMKL